MPALLGVADARRDISGVGHYCGREWWVLVRCDHRLGQCELWWGRSTTLNRLLEGRRYFAGIPEQARLNAIEALQQVAQVYRLR